MPELPGPEAFMSYRSFRFLQASDFRLDAVPHGLTEVADHLRDILLDAPYTAARGVFDTALAERVDFLLLVGNILQPNLTGPRGTAFLVEQFQRLAERGIRVYWAGGHSDPPEAWPTAIALPENVHFFPKDRVTDFLHSCDGSPLVRIVGASLGSRTLHPAEFMPDPVGLFSIGVVCGDMATAALQSHSAGLGNDATKKNVPETHPPKSNVLEVHPGEDDGQESRPLRGIHYWALGGRAEQATLFNSPGIAHYSGTPQGRSPQELGPHGCTLVQVDDDGRARMTFVPTGAMEWLHETVLIDPAMRREGLEAALAQRTGELREESKVDRLVTWSIGGGGPLLAELRRGKLRGELLDWLRIEHGLSSPVVWPVGIELAPHDALPGSLYEQETILGDFLRELRELELDPQQPLDLDSLLPGGQSAELFAQAVAIPDEAVRKRVLHEAAMLAAELLGGETAAQ